MEVDLTVCWEEYSASATAVGHTIVFGGKKKLAGVWVHDREGAALLPLRYHSLQLYDPLMLALR